MYTYFRILLKKQITKPFITHLKFFKYYKGIKKLLIAKNTHMFHLNRF